MRNQLKIKLSSVHCGGSGHALLGYDTMYWCGRIPTFQVKLRTAWPLEVLVFYHIANQCHNSEDLDLSPHRHENLKYHTLWRGRWY